MTRAFRGAGRTFVTIAIGWFVVVALYLGPGLLSRTFPDHDLALVYPGSAEVRRQVGESFTEVMVVSTASKEDILTFYRTTLEGRGYDFELAAAIPTTIEEFACGWRDDDRIMRLAFMDLDVLDPAFVAETMGGKTTMYRWAIGKGERYGGNRPCSILLEGDPVPSS